MYYYSNEIVFKGHPDKVADQISDAILDEMIKVNPYSRCAIETVGGKGKIFITGEVSNLDKLTTPISSIVNSVLTDVGYIPDYEIITNLGNQSADIALGVDDGGAGDQGMMFGYACRDTEDYIPKAQYILQNLSKRYSELVKTDNRFLADGKAQITGVYDNAGNLIKISDFTISYQNTEEDRESTDSIIMDIAGQLANSVDVEIECFHINPTGKFLIGGFEGDSGLTGRKIVVDSYESFSRVGGGAFSGKDATKVDRSAAYKARQIAIRTLKEHPRLRWCEVQIAYAIGLALPLSIYIRTNKGNIKPEDSLYEECRVKTIIDDLKLREPIFRNTAMYGHFGHKDFTWELR